MLVGLCLNSMPFFPSAGCVLFGPWQHREHLRHPRAVQDHHPRLHSQPVTPIIPWGVYHLPVPPCTCARPPQGRGHSASARRCRQPSSGARWRGPHSRHEARGAPPCRFRSHRGLRPYHWGGPGPPGRGRWHGGWWRRAHQDQGGGARGGGGAVGAPQDAHTQEGALHGGESLAPAAPFAFLKSGLKTPFVVAVRYKLFPPHLLPY